MFAGMHCFALESNATNLTLSMTNDGWSYATQNVSDIPSDHRPFARDSKIFVM